MRIGKPEQVVTSIVEKDSPLVPLLVLAVVFLILLGGGLGLAYVGGVFTGKNEVAERQADPRGIQ
jgi:hypothetical protein